MQGAQVCLDTGESMISPAKAAHRVAFWKWRNDKSAGQPICTAKAARRVAPRDGRNEYWWVQLRPQGLYYARRVDGVEVPIEEGECPDWDSLPAAPGARVLLCVPGVKVRIHSVSIPTRNRRRFSTALPFALEERLFRAPETYHFVPLARPAGQAGTPVAVVEREQVADWVGAATTLGLQLDLLIPDYLVLPAPAPDTWLLDALEKPFLLRFPDPHGGAVLSEHPGTTPPGGLQLALERSEQTPAKLQVRVRDREQYEQAENWREWLVERNMELERVQVNMPRPAWLARQAAPPARVSLLTGPYRPGRDRSLHARRFIPAAGLAAALVLVLAAQWFVEYSLIQAQHARLTGAIEAAYRQAFPEARRLVNPRHQMEQWLSAASKPVTGGQEQGIDILVWLERLAPLLANRADASLTAFNFDGRQLILDLSLPDFEALEALQKQLSAADLKPDVETAELKDGRVMSRLLLAEKS